MSDGDKTAKPKTAKDTAKLLGISERQLYKACANEILRWGRSDLMKKVQAGEMSIHAAWLEARGERKPTKALIDSSTLQPVERS